MSLFETPVSMEKRGEFAIISVNNPPVNALSHAVRRGLEQHITSAASDPSVTGIVLCCTGRTFIAGADITEFNCPPSEPSLARIIDLLETLNKPVVAAIHGTALGGGLELCLACHYRVADRHAFLGVPEVKLGLIPGAGGTVRLPYLIGPIFALEMIVTGDPVGAERAVELGLADAVNDAGPIDSALSFLADKSRQGEVPVAIRARRGKIESTDLSKLDKAIDATMAKARGVEALLAAAQAVRNAVTMPFDAALAEERRLFEQLKNGEQSRAQRHLFFAERAAFKVPGLERTVPLPVSSVGVIGAGTMGGGIAMAFANAGFPVTLVDLNSEALHRGRATIEANYDRSVRNGSLKTEERNKRLKLIVQATEVAALAPCDLIIEAAFEDMTVKKEIFQSLDRIAKPTAILATNTSFLDVNEIAATTSRPQNLLGMHFFSPANVMRLLEVVRGTHTSPEVIATIIKIGRKIGKIPVVVGVCRGFVGNRMVVARSSDIFDLLLEGATPASVDAVFTAFGWPMGPFQMQDLAGLDIGWRNRKSLGQSLMIADDLCERGHLGQKTGRGYYLYQDGSRTPVVDPTVVSLIEENARQLGIVRRPVSPEEILERTHFPMINEGSRIVSEGIAARWSDVDVVWVHGYGFPRTKGGPMYWADEFGLSKIVERLEYWHDRNGKSAFEPDRRLRDAAKAGGFKHLEN